MNQMQKRLEIIKIAISMTDEETIRLQLLKLDHFEDDNDLSEIISLLKQKYYAKAQEMISKYNTKIKDKADYEMNPENDINEVDCKSNTSNVNAIIKEFSSLKPTNPIKVKITKSYCDDNTPDVILSDTQINNEPDNTREDSPNSDSKLIYNKENFMYEKMPSISAIFHNLALHYCKNNSTHLTKAAEVWMKHIASSGYNDSEIYKILAHVNKLKEESNFTEAAQLILVCGSTESNLGQLLFARELIKGDLYEKNETSAFELIKELALAGYDEAICDYGQLVEYGIGTQSDSKHAEEIYKDAVNIDSERGKRLYENIRKKNHKFLSFLRR